MNLVSGWNNIWGSLVPQGLQIVLAAAGVFIIVVYIGLWLWQKRKAGVGGAATGFPTMATVLGCFLAGPNVIIPVLLAIVQGVLGVILFVMNWGASHL